MSKYIQSIDSKRGVIINPQRSKRKPRQENTNCPFCPVNERLTPPAIQDWPVRVFSNKYPILPHHEVIVHSPDHSLDIPDLPLSQISLIIETYITRYKALKKYGTIVIFNNSARKSGSTLAHPHSQIIAIPPEIKAYIPPLEPAQTSGVSRSGSPDVKNIVLQNTNFVAYCPAFSQFPYEVWICPKKADKKRGLYKTNSFALLKGPALKDFAQILQTIVRKITSLRDHPDFPYHSKFPNIPYNFYISPAKPFYLRIIPRLTTLAGFELASGLTVNPIPPSKAAKNLSYPNKKLK